MAERTARAGANPAPPPPLFLTANDVCRALRIARRTLDDLVAVGALPAPIKLSRKTVRWRRSEIEALESVA